MTRKACLTLVFYIYSLNRKSCSVFRNSSPHIIFFLPYAFSAESGSLSIFEGSIGLKGFIFLGSSVMKRSSAFKALGSLLFVSAAATGVCLRGSGGFASLLPGLTIPLKTPLGDFSLATGLMGVVFDFCRYPLTTRGFPFSSVFVRLLAGALSEA